MILMVDMAASDCLQCCCGHQSRRLWAAFTPQGGNRVSGRFRRARRYAIFWSPGLSGSVAVIRPSDYEPQTNEVTMLYAILAYHVEDEILSWTPEQDAAVVAKVIEVQAPLRASGHFGPAARLDDTKKARTLRGPGAGIVLDGPFAETKEQLLGFHLVDYDTEEEAIAAARKLRQINPSAVYEIRPVKLYVPADGFGAT
jgi:hypothetical protein